MTRNDFTITSNKQIKANFELWKEITTATRSDYWRYATDIYEAYDCPSHAKVNAFNYCKSLEYKTDGHGLVILGKNCMQFSVGFVGYLDGLKHFFYITRDYNRAMPLERVDEKTGEVLAI